MSTSVGAPVQVKNFIQGHWVSSTSEERKNVFDPATDEVIGSVTPSTTRDVDAAVAAAGEAFHGWRRTPPEDRIQPLFKLKAILETHLDELARIISRENGKTLTEAKAELRRAIENVEVACGIPTMMQGRHLEDVARGIDETMVYQPLGVVAIITPFNFPGMIPFWFLPYAIATGNTVVVKPSDRVPLTMMRVFELIETAGFPSGVVNLVNGGKTAVDALLDHPQVRAISFVGSTAIARYVYARAASTGKRVQCQGGAKNHVVIMPDADMETAAQIINDSAFGCAGQRCLAVSVAVSIGSAQRTFREAILDTASSLKVGNGLDPGIHMGPVITPESRDRIESMIALGHQEGATLLMDGRVERKIGNFVRPTILDGLPRDSDLRDAEIFGPVLSLVHAESLDEAIEFLERSAYGNQASLFTSSGANARQFRYDAPAGNIGINIGVAAPMAYFPFSGWKDSFFGDLHAQSHDGVEFYTQKKVVVERWGREHARKF